MLKRLRQSLTSVLSEMDVRLKVILQSLKFYYDCT